MSNEIVIKVVDREDNIQMLTVPTNMGLSLMEACKVYELPVEGVCGGMAMCATCHCYILSEHKLSDQSGDEKAMLEEIEHVRENSRLSCQITVSKSLDGLEIQLAPELVEDEKW